jgi:peptide/nickel transport system substrate-binding protein
MQCLSTTSLAALCAALAACQAPAPPAVSESPTLRLAVRADVTGFYPNPPLINEGYSMDVNWNLYDGLVRFDSRFRLEPAVASRWENPDERTYVFDVRPGLRFSDGRPVTAEDVVASILAPRKRQWVTRDYLQAVESARVLAPGRVEIRTRFPYLILLSKLPWGHVMPAAELVKERPAVVGTGPYRLESWTPGREFVFERNPYFRGPAPAFARARFEVVSDPRERAERVLRGEADVADQLPLDQIERVQGSPDVEVCSGPGIRVLMLVLRVDRRPFSDPRVREALDAAIDREELNRRALFGRAVPATQLVPQSVVGFNPALRTGQGDAARAKALLAAAGYKGRLALRLDGPSNRYVRDVEILQELKRQLDAAGFDVTLNVLDKNAYFALQDAGRSDAGLLGWACATGEAGDALDSFLHSKQGDILGTDNTMGLADAELDRLIENANAAGSLEERTALLQQALAHIAELRPILPLVVQPEAVAISRKVRWTPPPNYALRVQDMQPAP